MKKLILIMKLLVLVILFIFATVLAYDAVFGHLELGKKFLSKKKVKVTNKVSADNMTVISCKKKQVCEFTKLIAKLKENSFAFSLIKVELMHGSDPISMEKPPVTIEQLSNWRSFDFIYLEFPEGFMNKPGKLSIHCDNYDKKNPDFFVRIMTVRETSYGFRIESIPYYVVKTGKESVSEIEEQKYVLEAIEYALSVIKITVACDRVTSALLRMEKDEKKGHKPSSVTITTEDTVSK